MKKAIFTLFGSAFLLVSSVFGQIQNEDQTEINKKMYLENLKNKPVLYISKELINYECEVIKELKTKKDFKDLYLQANLINADLLTDLNFNKGVLSAKAVKYKKDLLGIRIPKK